MRGLLVLAVAGGLAIGFGVGFAWLDGRPARHGASLPTRTLTFAFQSKAPATRHLGRGWSEPEAWGVWSVGPHAELAIPIRERVEGDVTISIEARAYLVPSRADDQHVIVEANGAEVARLQYAGRDSQRATRVISVPKAVAARGSPMRIAFKISMPRSPAEMGVGRDTRALGIGLQTLTLSFPSNEIYVE